MNKAKLIETLVEKTGTNKIQVENILDYFEKTIMTSLKNGEEVTLTGFGTFSSKKRSARMGVNPRNPSEKIQVPEVVVPKFKAGKALKDFLKK